MSDCCNPMHPLGRDGTSQPGRENKALAPNSIELEDRSLDDLLVWLADMADLLVYWNNSNEPQNIDVARIQVDASSAAATLGTWRPLVESDISVAIARISGEDHRNRRARFLEQRDLAAKLSDPAAGPLNPPSAAAKLKRLDVFKALCQQLIDLASLFRRWHLRSVEGLTFRSAMDIAIESELAPIISRLKSYDDGAVALGADPDIPADPLGLDFTPLGEQFGVDSAQASSTIYQGTTFDEQLDYAVRRIELLYERMHKTLVRTVADAAGWLDESLEKYAYHRPDMALAITFLKLYEKVKARLNALSARHLDFFYERVLGLAHKAPTPDKAHLIIEIARKLSSHPLETGVGFDAGKDAEGQRLEYRLTEDTTFNSGVVDDLRSVFIQRADDDEHDATTFHVSPVIEGTGAPFPEGDEPRWQPFASDSIQVPVGFAIASPMLFLAEGTRKVSLTLHFDNVSSIASNLEFNYAFSVEKGWYPEPLEDGALTGIPKAVIRKVGHRTVKIVMELPLDAPAVVETDQEVHGPGFDPRWPLLKLQATRPSDYAALTAASLESFDIVVNVSDVKTAVLRSDQGVILSDKPFLPFGTRPGIGATMLIGSWEIFQKDSTRLDIALTWPDDLPSEAIDTIYHAAVGAPGGPISDPRDATKDYLPTSSGFLGAAVELLLDGEWNAVKIRDVKPKNPVNLDNEFTIELDLKPNSSLARYESFQLGMQSGFVRLKLQTDLQHDDYPFFIANRAVVEEPALLPPYTPLAAGLTLGYRAEHLDIKNDDNIDRLYHLTAFGHRLAGSLVESPPVSLLPRFEVDEPDGDGGTVTNPTVGELYIGISNLETRQNLSLLIQVAEGSADPLSEPPLITWSYLVGNTWVDFAPDEILAERTRGLIASGIVRLALPREANRAHTLLPADRHWLRGVVSESPRGICDIVGVHAQAATVELFDQQNAASHLTAPLPAGTIAKLVHRDVGIRGIVQPYASFGARPTEDRAAFNRRVSERLRHKDRASSIWDYERLVLEAFPEIYKVKCLSHTRQEKDAANGDVTVMEAVPGHVTVVVIANAFNRNAIDPLEPRASSALLDRVRSFLLERTTHFLSPVVPGAEAALQVINPYYVQVRTDFDVIFKPGVDVGHFLGQLDEDLRGFLAPWTQLRGTDIGFGGVIDRSTLVDFIDERDYVEAVINFRLWAGKAEVQNAVAASAASILTSAPSHQPREAA